MKMVFKAFSARLGGVFVPASLKLPDHPRIRRVESAWPTENPIVRALREKWVLPGILKAEQTNVLSCPGRVVGARASAGCLVLTMFRGRIPFDFRVRKSIPFGLQRLRNWLLSRIMLKSMSEADSPISIFSYAHSLIESLAKVENTVPISHVIS